MGNTSEKLQGRRIQKKILFPFLNFAYIPLTTKGSYGTVSASSITPSTSHLHHIRDISTSCTTWWYLNSPHTHRSPNTMNQELPDLYRLSDNCSATSPPQASLLLSSQDQGVLAFQKVCDEFPVLIISGAIPTIISIFFVLTLADTLSSARSCHRNHTFKYRILKLVMIMKTVIRNWQSIAHSGIKLLNTCNSLD